MTYHYFLPFFGTSKDGQLEIVEAQMELDVMVLSARLHSSQARLIFVRASEIPIASGEAVYLFETMHMFQSRLERGIQKAEAIKPEEQHCVRRDMSTERGGGNEGLCEN
ncbi:uncharacterized [Tachysurus ichikawai]